MLSALDQAYLDFMRLHGGKIPIGYGGAQAGTGTGGVDGAGPIMITQNGRIDTGNGIKNSVVLANGTIEGVAVLNGIDVKFRILPNGTQIATFNISIPGIDKQMHFTITDFPDGAVSKVVRMDDLVTNTFTSADGNYVRLTQLVIDQGVPNVAYEVVTYSDSATAYIKLLNKDGDYITTQWQDGRRIGYVQEYREGDILRKEVRILENGYESVRWTYSDNTTCDQILPPSSDSEMASDIEKYHSRLELGTDQADRLQNDGYLLGMDGNDVLTGRAKADFLDGGEGDDTLEGGAGADRLNGGLGFDVASYISAAAGVAVSLTMSHANAGDAAGDELFSIEGLFGSNFNDRLYGDDLVNRFHGGGGNDEMHGWGGDDALYGGAGDDRVVGGAGADYVFGDTGLDMACYYTAAAGVVVDLTNTARNTGDAKGDRYQSIENLAGSKFDDNLTADNNANGIYGYSGHDVLHGLGGNDTLQGDEGDDILIGGAGADRLIGGAGLGDMVAYNAVNGQGVTVHLAKPQRNSGEAAGDTYDGVENVAGTAYTDTLVGDAKNNILYGLGSDDILRGGLGADVLVGGEGFDWASYGEATSGVRADLINPTLNIGEATGDTLIEIEGLQGSEYGDQLAGDGGHNALSGLGGFDVLQGAAAMTICMVAPATTSSTAASAPTP